MGLFIGASILTILELFDYLYEVKYLSPEYLPSLSAASLLDREKASTGVCRLWKFVVPLYRRITHSQNPVFPHNFSICIRTCFSEHDERSVPHNPTACDTHIPYTHLNSSNAEYINILVVLYFRLVRMCLSVLIRPTLCCTVPLCFLLCEQGESFLCVSLIQTANVCK